VPNQIQLKGFREFRSKLKSLPKEVKQEIGFEVQDAAANWEGRAKRDAPKDQGFLSNHITSRKTGEMNAQVVSGADYSAYMEWGTKLRVRVPANIASYAAQFRGAKSGRNAKQMIYAWMNRVGIPEERQWIVFISIIVNGVKPQPFFFIQRPIVEKEFISSVRNILNTEH
jgi:HK97 gp10 family phage protein